jgi:hypothetical protein
VIIVGVLGKATLELLKIYVNGYILANAFSRTFAWKIDMHAFIINLTIASPRWLKAALIGLTVRLRVGT